MLDVIPIVPVGPGEFDAARATRVLGSLARHEAGVACVVLLIDGVTEQALREKLGPVPLPLRFVENPRAGRGDGVYDGLACGLTAAYGAIAREFPGRHVWKIDSDALVLRPCRRQIADYFAQNPRVGMVGTYATNPGNVSRQAEIDIGVEVARKFLKPIWYWRSTGRLSIPLFGRDRRFAGWMRRANAAGLPWGWHVQGGSYALRAEALAHWLSSGRFDDPMVMLGVPMGEDVAFTHWIFMDGFLPGQFNAPGETFGVKAKGLPMPVDELVAANYGVVHSLKTGDWASECALADELIGRTSDRITHQCD